MKQDLINIIKNVLQPGTDKGSSQAIIDTKDFSKLADELVEYFNTIGI